MSQEEIQDIRYMCKQLERIAGYTICFETDDKIWIDQKDLDWLADDEADSYAIKLRKIAKFNIDFKGGYYYFLKS
ncbi:hypothetical protein CCL45_gp57 [Sulfolobus islandicus rod-shaped virus 5]|uniref:Uncharacterized protein n=2 Tax=Usarudivirus SIRV5 TaxID=2846591 RepID=A0A1X9SKL0_9VIRU|nr:hypothetical protein CCL45_gp57 [Sulfolobus islandicus rod-shaped virus 5]YP_009362918.1 hypothetical protein CCL44_gp56 [Sulfolobus islandicus rod-shaped phage 6]ARQ96679.1 hypothetical protein [Sulfolobus islandicus rod-shaped virus 5]ARQ96785.1 hypothetical protein [Sulfolobus islandicus rod-shaped phage 6]